MDRFIVAIAHLDQVARQLVRRGWRRSMYSPKSPPCRRSACTYLSSDSSKFQDFGQLLFRQLLAGRQVAQADILRAELDEDFVHLRVVIDVFDPLFAGDLVERRLGDIDKALFDQLRHLPVKKCQQ
jgi:hypothetical protein